IVRTFAAPSTHESCIAHHLAPIYRPTSTSCGGCPTCREHGNLPYANPPEVNTSLPLGDYSARHMKPYLHDNLRIYDSLVVTWDGSPNLGELTRYSELLALLVAGGMQQLILPTKLLNGEWPMLLVKRLGQHARIPHRLIEADRVGSLNYPL